MSQYRSFRHRLAALVTLGAFATAGCFVVDDTDSDDDEGDAGESGNGGSGGSVTPRGGNAGTSAGGSTSTGGSETGGSDTGGSDTGGNGGSGPAGAGGTTSTGGSPPTGGTGGSSSGAVMKFCNDLARGDMDITLTVEFAGVTASALSGQCTPVVPNACIAIPTGTDPMVELREGSEVILSGSFPTLTVAAGDEIFVLAAIDPADMLPGLFADTFENIYGTSCASTDPITAPPLMSRSAGFDVPSQRNLRNAFTPSVLREAKSPLNARLAR